MDKKNNGVIIGLFALIVIGSIVYTIFSVVNSGELEVDNRANIIKEGMVSMEQTVDDGIPKENDDKNSNESKDDKEFIDNTINSNQSSNTISSNNNPNVNNNLNNNSSIVNIQSQNKPSGSQNNQSNKENKPNTNKPNGNNTTNTNTSINTTVDNSNSENITKPVEETEEPPKVIKNSIFELKTDSQGYYKEGMQLRQEGTNIYIDGVVDANIDKIYVPLLVKAPESYSNVQFHGFVGNKSIDGWFEGEGSVPTTAFAIRHVAGSIVNIQIGWQDGEIINYTIHFNIESKN